MLTAAHSLYLCQLHCGHALTSATRAFHGHCRNPMLPAAFTISLPDSIPHWYAAASLVLPLHQIRVAQGLHASIFSAMQSHAPYGVRAVSQELPPMALAIHATTTLHKLGPFHSATAETWVQHLSSNLIACCSSFGSYNFECVQLRTAPWSKKRFAPPPPMLSAKSQLRNSSQVPGVASAASSTSSSSVSHRRLAVSSVWSCDWVFCGLIVRHVVFGPGLPLGTPAPGNVVDGPIESPAHDESSRLPMFATRGC